MSTQHLLLPGEYYRYEIQRSSHWGGTEIVRDQYGVVVAVKLELGGTIYPSKKGDCSDVVPAVVEQLGLDGSIHVNCVEINANSHLLVPACKRPASEKTPVQNSEGSESEVQE